MEFRPFEGENKKKNKRSLFFLEQRGLAFRETARGQKLVLFALHISPPLLPFFSAEFSSFSLFNIFYLVS
jgi:hypothetical protein